MRRRPIAGLVAASLLALTACGDSEPSSPSAADLESIDLTPEVTIVVDEAGFDPATIEVAPGTVIRLVNEGDEPHSFTAEERFDTGRLEPGEDTVLVLTEPGEIPYLDVADPDHEGTLTILPDPDR
jgi:plastocyanin